MRGRTLSLLLMSPLLLFACGEREPGAVDDAGSEVVKPVGERCLADAQCESGLCVRSLGGSRCSIQCGSADDCIDGWVCEPHSDQPLDVCVYRGDTRDLCQILEVDRAHCGVDGPECPMGLVCVDGRCERARNLLTKPCRIGAEVWRMSELEIAAEHGFDLDAHATTADDPEAPAIGCGQEDGPSGIDNAMAALAALLSAPEQATPLDLNALLAEAITRKALELVVYIRGYEEGGPNDEIQLAIFVDGAEHPSCVDEPAELIDGKLIATLDLLTFTLSGAELGLGDAPISLNLLDVRIELDEPAAGDSVAHMMIGGAAQYHGEGGLSAALASLAEQLELDTDLDAAASALLDLSSNGEGCDLLSVGARLRMDYAPELCE